LQTSYVRNAFGEVTQLTSPDTGIGTTEIDEDGDVLETADSRGRVAEYSHDALGRLTSVEYGDQTVANSFDAGANAVGRLSQLTNGASTLAWTYDGHGRVATTTQTVDGLARQTTYSFDTSGRLSSLTTPSGQLIAYQYLNGRFSGIQVNGIQLISNILYGPFGPTRGWQWGNGTFTVREYDADGRITAIDSAGLATYTYFADGSIQSISDESLTPSSATEPSLSVAVSSTSNRIESIADTSVRSITYDAAGNTLSDGLRSFSYDDAGRLVSATRDGATTLYAYNGLGQRVRKSGTGVLQYFVYDESGHLLGAYGPNGTLIEEIVWFGDIPIATIRTTETGGIGFFYIHTDHLNTPTRITRHADNAVMWRWDRDPYGNGAPNEDAEANGQFVFFNLRFPGQQFDPETGLHYNYFRDYVPASGRYAQSDAIGLRGGINTYGYVSGNPVMSVDPRGLAESRPRNPGVPYVPGLFDIFFPNTPANDAWVDGASQAIDELLNPATSNNVIDFEKKRKEREKEKERDCPPDDGNSCFEEQARLNAVREMIRSNYRNTDILTYRTAVLMFNSEVTAHNTRCPSYLVPPLKVPGPVDYIPSPPDDTLPPIGE
jgi:RHS repeat-associated protein